MPNSKSSLAKYHRNDISSYFPTLTDYALRPVNNSETVDLVVSR
jgi:hypothetical protein